MPAVLSQGARKGFSTGLRCSFLYAPQKLSGSRRKRLFNPCARPPEASAANDTGMERIAPSRYRRLFPVRVFRLVLRRAQPQPGHQPTLQRRRLRWSLPVQRFPCQDIVSRDTVQLRQGGQHRDLWEPPARFTQLKIRAWKAGLCCRQSGKRFRFPGPGFSRCL